MAGLEPPETGKHFKGRLSKSQLDSSSHHERSSGGGGSICSVRKWIERSFMIIVGLVMGYGVIYTRHVTDIMNAHTIDHELFNGPSILRRATNKTHSNQERLLRKTSIQTEPPEVLIPPRPEIDPQNKNPLLKSMFEEMKLQKKKDVAAAEAAAEKDKLDRLSSIVEDIPNENTETKTSSGDNTLLHHVDEDDRLNVVLFYADDWTTNVMGKLNSEVKTPNIDKMADNGMMFLNNCVTTSVCWISRATLVTGTYYSRHLQALPFMDNMFNTHNWTETLFPKMRNAGYYTGIFGKWHSPQPRGPMKEAFDERIMYYGKHWSKEFTPHGSNEMEHVTESNKKHSIKFLENRPRDKKFFLKTSFFATHAEDDTQPSYKPQNWSRFEYYPDDETHENYTTMVPPSTATEKHWKDLPFFFTDNNCGRVRWRKRWEPSCWQKNIRDLYALATEVDQAVGAIIDVLKQQGVYNETLLIFTTDNGDLHGQHGLAEKWYPFEESMKVPLVIQDPRMSSELHGQVNHDWTLNVDLAPTILRAAGLEASSFMQGRDVAELYLSGDQRVAEDSKKGGKQGTKQKKPWETNIRRYAFNNSTAPWRQEWYYEWNMGDIHNASGHQQNGFIDAAFALINNEWKYIYWPQKEYEQLFHRSLDPYDEFDILQNYFINQKWIKERRWVEPSYRIMMESFTVHNATPIGDSVQSTMEIYKSMKERFKALQDHVQDGGRI